MHDPPYARGTAGGLLRQAVGSHLARERQRMGLVIDHLNLHSKVKSVKENGE